MKRAVGRAGSSQKYDILTILGTFALSQDRRLQRQTLRLICLITARYNWQHDMLEMGQAEIARLWSCDIRTVKREMAAFRDMGWLKELRPAARGRVAVHGLGIAKILADTRVIWEKIGPDVVQRLSVEAPPVSDDKIIPFPTAEPVQTDHATPWGYVGDALRHEDPVIYQAWFASLEPSFEEGILHLRAPGRFHARYVATHLRARIERHMMRIAPNLALEIS